jgi:hypothetical protein
MKIQISKWLVVIATFVSLMFVVTGLEAAKGGGGKPDKPGPSDSETGALNCVLLNDVGGTVQNDGLGEYMDGVDKVACGHGPTDSAYGIQLNTVSKGALKRAIRKIDLAFGSCIEDYACKFLPNALLGVAGGVADMEDVWIGTGPYPGMDHISLLDTGKYAMKSHMSLLGFADRFVIQLMSADPFPPELGQGGWCKLEQNPEFEWSDAATAEDMTVCIWPDDNGDSRPDGYTITTGSTACSTTWPAVTPGYREATICSTAGPYTCDGSDMCNLLGTVPLQLTLHATYQ